MTPAARIAGAIELLAAIEASTRPADAVANDFFRNRRFIGSGDRRAISERTWSVLRTHRRLVWWLDRHLPLAPTLVVTSRLMIAASLLLDGWNLDGLTQAFSGGRFGAAPLSAGELTVLRGLEGHTQDHPDMPEAVRLEVPDWILPGLRARFGATIEAELGALGEEAPLDLRTNLLKTTREEAQAALALEGIEAAPTRLSPWGLRIEGRRPVTSGRAFQSGLVEIQDEGSQLVAALVGAGPDMRVVDFCAGAGGKTLAMAMTMRNHGHIVACDVSPKRLEGAVRRLRRAGVHNVESHLIVPGDKWAKRRGESFDRVLVDAPCTGSGTWRRNPDGRLRLAERDLEELLPKQSAILDQAARLVRKGGFLVYATCSLLNAENEDQVAAFVTRNPAFSEIPDRRLSLTPLRDGTDGFFAAVLARAA